MKVYEAIAEQFVAEGARVVFNLMGDGNKLWLVRMSRYPEVTLVNARHEAAAMTMADGFARASGEVGICSVTYSTGITQIATPLAVSAKHGTPLVVFAADIPREHVGYGSQIDLDFRAVITACGGVVHEVRGAGTVAEDVRSAFHRARTERRPVVLIADPDLQEDESRAATAFDDAGTRPAGVRAQRVLPEEDAVRAAAGVIAAAKRPVLLLGRGAVEACAVHQARVLAERAGALLATTLHAKGCVDDDPYNVGVAGSYSDRRARSLLARADCLVAVGASLNRYTRAHGELFASIPIVRVDNRSNCLADLGSDTLFVQGDAATTMQALATAVEGERETWRDETTARLLEQDSRWEEITDVPASSRALDPRHLVYALDRVLPNDCEVVIGVGNFTTFPVRFLTNTGSRRFHTLLDFITIGQALPSAVGTALGSADRPVVAFEGDASFMMNIQELETAVRYEVPLLLFVLNDGALGAEYHKLRAHGADWSQSVLPTPDICDLAAAFGARVRRIEDVSEVDDVAAWFDPTSGPHVVDCPVTRAVAGEL